MLKSTEAALRWFLQKKLAEEKFRIHTPYIRHITEESREPGSEEMARYKATVDRLSRALEEKEND